MFFSRRRFLNKSFLSALGLPMSTLFSACNNGTKNKNHQKKSVSDQSGFKPVVVATWKNEKANEAAMQVLNSGGNALDAAEAGARVPEADPEDSSVGYGGLPDSDGNVTLDACIMDSKGNCGAVTFLKHIKHPISVARKVMEDTPHVMLSGDGALEFALSKGFKKENLLTENAKRKWQEWKKESKYQPIINVENHDTIGMLTLDEKGDIAGACTTSGLAFKMPGRVGDSPIIGAGLFVDNEIGGAVATGLGEAVMKTLGSYLVVELMRQGKTPEEACREAVMRIIKNQNYQDFQVGFLALNKKGQSGAYSVQSGFSYVRNTKYLHQLKEAPYFIPKKEQDK